MLVKFTWREDGSQRVARILPSEVAAIESRWYDPGSPAYRQIGSTVTLKSGASVSIGHEPEQALRRLGLGDS